MIVRRIGLVLAVALSLIAIPPALAIRPDPGTGEIGPLPIAIAALSCAIAVVTLGFLVPAWRGRRGASLTVAGAQLAGIVTALPAFFAPADVVPQGGVVAAAIGTLVTIAIFAAIAFDVPAFALNAIAVIVVVAVYAGVVAAATWSAPPAAERLVQTATAIVVAVAYQPLVSLLRRTVGRALYGGRLEPATTALRISRRAPDEPDAVKSALEDAVAALRLPRVELLDSGVLVAAGTTRVRAATASAVDLPLDAGGTMLLRITLRAGERMLQRDDRAALSLIALPLALLVRESALIAEMRATRAALADTREREQLALHRDLHDGLGPLLTGAVMRADAARNLLDADADPVRQQLDAARADLRAAVAEVRRVVYGLWPLELEQRGLRGAIAARAARAGVSVRMPDAAPPLPPAVELAVYRIASEALANAEKHAPGRDAALDLEFDADAVELTVVNGRGSREPGPVGMGLTSIRARAEELGGHMQAGPAEDGWRVHVRIPSGSATPPSAHEDLSTADDAVPGADSHA